jgi:hypothetical protein
MDVRDERKFHPFFDFTDRGSRFPVGDTETYDLAARVFQAADLADGLFHVGRGRARHRLDAYERVTADGDITDKDLAGLSFLNRHDPSLKPVILSGVEG